MRLSYMATYLITLWIISLTTDSFQELLLIREPVNYEKEPTRTLTCLAEDDGSALALNTDLQTISEPSSTKNLSLCYHITAKFTSCMDLSNSGSIRNWQVASSLANPMGPVFDYRWEGFTEYSLAKVYDFYAWSTNTLPQQDTMIFSIRGLGAIEVNLSEQNDPLYNNGEWFTLPACLKNKSDATLSCLNGGSKFSKDGLESKAERNQSFISEYEWQTFILEWNENEMNIQAHGSNKPRKRQRRVTWTGSNYLWVRSFQPGRVRLHSYNYLLTTKEDTKLYIHISDHHEQNLCIELLVSLCSECEMIVSVVNNGDNSNLKIGEISGGEKPESTKLPSWRQEKMTTTVPNDYLPDITLEISTQMRPNAKRGVERRWAIGHWRKCPSADAVRVSPIVTTRKQTGSSYIFPIASCQKLSYSGNSVVRMDIANTHNISSSLQKCLRGSVSMFCRYQQNYWGNGTSFCEKSGCTCTPGFTGSDCKEECSNGYYGYDCRESCDHCENKACIKTTGLCSGDCVDHYLPPYCKTKLEAPNVSIEGTTVVFRLNYSTELDMDEIRDLHFQLKTGQRDWTIPETRLQNGSTFETTIFGLSPWTRYTVRTVMQAPTAYGFWAYFESSEIDFETNSPAEATDTELPPCSTDSCNINNEYSKPPQNSSCNQDQVPEQPQNFRLISQGKGVVTLLWHHSKHICTKIAWFEVKIIIVNSKLQETPRPEDQMKIIRVRWPNQQAGTSNINSDLLTSTLYNFSITAINKNGISKTAIALFKIPASLGFGSKEAPSVKRNENFIELKIPAVINATRYSYVKVIVKGQPAQPSCTGQNISADLKKLVNMTEKEAGWIPTEIILTKDLPKNLTIGNDPLNNSTKACALSPKETYVVVLVLDGQVYIPAVVTASPEVVVVDSHGGSNQWIPFFFIFLICGVAIFIWRRKLWIALKRVRLQNLVSYSEALLNIIKSWSICATQRPLPLVVSTDIEATEISSTPGVVTWSRYSKSVKIEDFEDYAKESIANGLLRMQFMMFPRGLIKPYTYGALPVNKKKNRYANIIAYDDTRVILTENPNDPHSDYINANYVQGFHKKNGYIATQGPKPETVEDFWRMIWQEESRTVCMLTNVIEGEKVKCTQYWPEYGNSRTYGDIVITTERHDVFVDYTFRTFRVSCKAESRKIEHLHYTGWSDHTVPMFPNSVIAYLKKLQEIPVQNGPIIVHCSAGIGRTGTIILCDICLRQALTNGTVDVLKEFKKLRDCRMNMVDNELQYVFVHIVLAGCFVSQPTELKCNVDLPQAIEELKKNLPQHMERLRDIAWQDEALHPKTFTRTPFPEQLAKNRYPELAPVSSAPVYLTRYPQRDTHSDYISAVTVNGVKLKNQYVASQLPLPSTLSDLWRLIAEQRIELIIILQQPDLSDPTCCEIIPGEEPLNPVPFINVELKTRSGTKKPYRTVELLLTDTSENTPRTQRVTMLTCRKWGTGKDGKPPSPNDLVKFWMASTTIHRAESPTLVLCHDGVTGCGLYLALSFLLERMAVERECDIILAVRTIRQSRAEYVQSQEQLVYLCDAAAQYFETFETYANFT